MAKFIWALESPHYPINKVLINISENQQIVPNTGEGCPSILWTSHPLSYLSLNWIQSWATCSSWPRLEQREQSAEVPSPHEPAAY